MSRLEALANALREAARTRQPIDRLSAREALSVADAYAVQRLNVDRAVADGRRIVGHKVGLTSKAMQEMLGVSEPDFGVLLDDMVVADGAAIRLDALLQPRVEAEIAFWLSAPLRGPGVTVDDVLDATDALVPALEVIDSRIREWDIGLVDTIADNGSSALAVVSTLRTSARALDLRTVGCILERNGELVEHGAGAAVLGHPAACVAWLANTLGMLGDTLEPGHLVLPGALHRAVAVEPGDVVTATFAGLGAVTARFVRDHAS